MNKWMILLASAVLWTAVACSNFGDLNGIDKIGDDAEFAVPLINTKASLQDLLENFDEYTFIDVDEEGLILLRYQGNVVTKTSQEIFASIQAALPPSIPVIDSVFNFPFSTPGGVDIDYVELSKGDFRFSFINDQPDPINMTVVFPQLFKPDGSPLTFSYSDVGAGQIRGILPPFPPLSLVGHSLQADANGNIKIEYTAINQVTLERIKVGFFIVTLQNMEFSYAEGYFGNQLHDGGRDTIEIEFFENWRRGDVYFEDPKIYVNVFNSFGVPTRSIVNNFAVYNVEGDSLPLQADALENGIDFAYPTLDEVGEEKVTQFSLTKDNSNIREVLGSEPVALDYDVDAITNPDNDTAIRGFITDNSRYSVFVEVELPIYGSASGFAAIDTFEVNLSNFESVEEVEFKLITRNELPLDVGIQLYFATPQGQVLDSMFITPEKLIQAAPVNGEGIATETVEKIIYTNFDAARFAKVKDATHLILNAAFSTYDNGGPSVKVLSHQQVEILLGAILKRKD